MILLTLKIGKNQREIPVVSEHLKEGRNTLVAYNYQSTDESKTSKMLAALSHAGQKIHSLVAVNDSRVLLAATKSTLIVGVASGKFSSFSDFSYTFYNFETNDIITCLDARVSTTTKPLTQSRRAMGEKPKTARNHNTPIVDVVIGGARGPIYFYNDLIAKLETMGGEDAETLLARKYHWHRRAVHAIKWSRDGMLTNILGVSTPRAFANLSVQQAIT